MIYIFCLMLCRVGSRLWAAIRSCMKQVLFARIYVILFCVYFQHSFQVGCFNPFQSFEIPYEVVPYELYAICGNGRNLYVEQFQGCCYGQQVQCLYLDLHCCNCSQKWNKPNHQEDLISSISYATIYFIYFIHVLVTQAFHLMHHHYVEPSLLFGYYPLIFRN